MNPDNWEELDGGSCGNGAMVSNLPLVFSNGFPISLEDMTLSQFEEFFAFMVKCSVGADLNSPWAELPRPQWWPTRLPYRIPSGHNAASTKNILTRLVLRCYTFHGCDYLLKFCTSLYKLQPAAGYRMSDNRDGTTSMFDASTGKLLVTFRNENKNYDKAKSKSQLSSQKKLLPSTNHTNNNHHGTPHKNAGMVQPPVLDVYLCDKCDDEFNSLKEVHTHEKVCKGYRPFSPQLPSPYLEDNEEDVDLDEQVPFLSYLGLDPGKHTGVQPYSSPRKRHPSPTKKRSLTQNYLRFDSIDVCSPMGRYILSHCKYGGRLQIPEHFVFKYEKYIPAFPGTDYHNIRDRSNGQRWMVVWRPRRNEQSWTHLYSFTWEDRRERALTVAAGLNRRGRSMLSKCKPVKILLKRLSKRYIDRKTRLSKAAVCIDLTAGEDSLPSVSFRSPMAQSIPSGYSLLGAISPVFPVVQPKSQPINRTDEVIWVEDAVSVKSERPSLQSNLFESHLQNRNRSSALHSSFELPFSYSSKEIFENQQTDAGHSSNNSLYRHENTCDPFINNDSVSVLRKLSKHGITISTVDNPSYDVRDPLFIHSQNRVKPNDSMSPTSRLKPSISSGFAKTLVPDVAVQSTQFSDTRTATNQRISDVVEIIDLCSDDESEYLGNNILNKLSKNLLSHWLPFTLPSGYRRIQRRLAANGYVDQGVSSSKSFHDTSHRRSSRSLAKSSLIPFCSKATLHHHCSSKFNKSVSFYSCVTERDLLGAEPCVHLDTRVRDGLSIPKRVLVDNEVSIMYNTPSLQLLEDHISVSEPENEYSLFKFGSLINGFTNNISNGISYFKQLVNSGLYSRENVNIEKNVRKIKRSLNKHKNNSLTKESKTSREIKRLRGDECRELNLKGLGMLDQLGSKNEKVTRCMAGKAMENLLNSEESETHDLPTKQHNDDFNHILKQNAPLKECDSSELFHKSRRVNGLKSYLQSTEIEDLDDNYLLNVPLQSMEEVEPIIKKSKIRTKMLFKHSNTKENIDSIENVNHCQIDLKRMNKRKKKLEKVHSKRAKLPRDLLSIVKDECKELRVMGFHPSDVLGTSSPLKDMKSSDNLKRAKIPRELNRIIHDECKELRLMGFHPSDVLGSENSDGGNNHSTTVLESRDSHVNNLKSKGTSCSPLQEIESKNHFKRTKIPRELRRIIRDECKELRLMGFHPSDIMGSENKDTSANRVTPGKSHINGSESRNSHLNDVESKDLTSHHLEYNVGVNNKPHKLPRELLSIAQDECKELRDMGFHPSDILGTSGLPLQTLDSIEINSRRTGRPSLLAFKNNNTRYQMIHDDVESDLNNNKMHLVTQSSEHTDHKVNKELANLMNDEWKEMKSCGWHPSQIQHLVKLGRLARVHSKSDTKLEDDVNRLKYNIMKNSRPYHILDTLTPRKCHRDFIQSSGGMCVLNYMYHNEDLNA